MSWFHLLRFCIIIKYHSLKKDPSAWHVYPEKIRSTVNIWHWLSIHILSKFFPFFTKNKLSWSLPSIGLSFSPTMHWWDNALTPSKIFQRFLPFSEIINTLNPIATNEDILRREPRVTARSVIQTAEQSLTPANCTRWRVRWMGLVLRSTTRSRSWSCSSAFVTLFKPITIWLLEYKRR